MSPLRLDPDDPFASVLRWLAALAHALGIDPSRPLPRVRLNHAAAAAVRCWLADASRQLRTLIRAKAGRLAASLALKLRRARRNAAVRLTRPRAARVAPATATAAFNVEARRRRLPAPHGAAPPSVRPASDAWLNSEEDAAMRRRTRAVLSALIDPSAAVRRLALRLAKRLDPTKAAQAVRLNPFPYPPRALGVTRLELAFKPEPRPPDAPASACRTAARTAEPAAATPTLGRSRPYTDEAPRSEEWRLMYIAVTGPPYAPR